ncbi:MAG: hypothetical protein ABEH38_08625 [Flavobacteriales bacterium]
MESLEPFLYQPWKHHLPFLQERILVALHEGDKEAGIPEGIKKIGASVTDLYVGGLSLKELQVELCGLLGGKLFRDPEGYKKWLGSSGYRIIALSDTSEWAMKYAHGGGLWAHIHPARGSPLSVRVRGTVLCSAFRIVLEAERFGMDPFDKGLIDQVRKAYLDLSPVRHVDPRKGLGRMIRLLADR